MAELAPGGKGRSWGSPAELVRARIRGQQRLGQVLRALPAPTPAGRFQLNTSVQEVKSQGPESAPSPAAVRAQPVQRSIPRAPARILFAVPLAVLVACGVHLWASRGEPPAQTRPYWLFLAIIFGAALLAAAIQPFWAPLRRWMRNMCPIMAVAVLLLSIWETITAGFRLLPLPYFPSPAGVLQSLLHD